ncbi:MULTISPECIES: amino acid transporter [unclassified Chelatococcus]|uniref:nucleotidyltransferase domain-containing protein n=1 Tax=unclassified Chelatococcus TaxID=2638111 RepID=UPI001BCFC077|nr:MULTISPECIES: amino acid transporter [unclassified Chelatococcus]MBS7699470.1 amino acid transporter [Chelatococcus sp. YT9]MBX3557638.1 amino acid transporter [Chelatococcus sp.]
MPNHLAVPDQHAWAPWHPAELAQRLAGTSSPWCVVGGWALDLCHGRETRPHSDLEFTVLRKNLPAFRQRLGELEFYTVKDGTIEPLSTDEEPAADVAQIWCFARSDHRWRVDMMIEPGTPATWIYKRDPTITRPRSRMVARSPCGIPYLQPAAVLLFKAKDQRPKDEVDFARALPLLPAAERLWLKDCLDRLHPGHPWAQALQSPFSLSGSLSALRAAHKKARR